MDGELAYLIATGIWIQRHEIFYKCFYLPASLHSKPLQPSSQHFCVPVHSLSVEHLDSGTSPHSGPTGGGGHFPAVCVRKEN